MKKFDFRKATYNVSGIRELGLDLAMRLWRAKYETVEHFRRAVIKSPLLNEFYEFMVEMWDDIKPVTIEEAFQQKNAEMRRVYFECIGVVNMFKQLEPELVDRQVINKNRASWDDDNVQIEYSFEDVYELYRIPALKLFGDVEGSTRFGRGESEFVYAVRCWCTSTGHEFWLYVTQEASIHEDEKARGITRSWQNPTKFDVVSAIAWTIRIGITNPERIYRQGDVVIVKASKNSKEIPPYHLNKDQYLKLMYSES